MMAELFDEEYLRGQYNKSRDREMLEAGRAEGRAEGRTEGIAEGIVEGKISTLIGLVRDNLLTVAEAAKRAEMSVSEFEAKAKLS